MDGGREKSRVTGVVGRGAVMGVQYGWEWEKGKREG